MSNSKPTLVWLRRDLRLSDHPALLAACENGGAVIPVFIHDDTVEAWGCPQVAFGAWPGSFG